MLHWFLITSNDPWIWVWTYDISWVALFAYAFDWWCFSEEHVEKNEDKHKFVSSCASDVTSLFKSCYDRCYCFVSLPLQVLRNKSKSLFFLKSFLIEVINRRKIETTQLLLLAIVFRSVAWRQYFLCLSLHTFLICLLLLHSLHVLTGFFFSCVFYF